MSLPYSPDTAALLTRSLTQVVRAWLLPPAGDPIPLELERCQFGWDETRAPRVTASLTARVPTDQAVLNLFDPRIGARISIHAGYVRPGTGTEDVQPVADLGLRTRAVTRPDNRMELDAAGDEALVIDNSPVPGGSTSMPSHTAAIAALIVAAIGGTQTFTAAGAAVTVESINDRWSTLEDLADRIDYDVYDDGLRVWHCVPRPVLAGVPAHALVVGQNGTLLTSSASLDRAAWFNAVTLRYVWRTVSGVEQSVTATRAVTAGAYAVTGPAGKRVYTEDRAVATTQAAANAAADAILKRFLSRSRAYELRAIAAYWLRPGHTVTVQLPLGDPESHLVAAVSFDPIAGTMDVRTRLPDNASTIGAA